MAPIKTRELTIYLIETRKVDNGKNPVSELVISFVRSCITDKIFAHKEDKISVLRDDRIEFCHFDDVKWESLKTIEETIRNDRYGEEIDPIEAITKTVDYIKVQDSRDSYEARKVIFFARLDLEELELDRVKAMLNLLKANKIFLSFIFPPESTANAIQKKNMELLRTLPDKYELLAVCDHKEARVVLANTLTKKATKSMPWNCTFTIGSSISFGVKGYVCTRKNQPSQLRKQIYSDQGAHIPLPSTSQAPGSSNGGGGALARIDGGGPSSSRGDVDEDDYLDYKDVVEKEVYYVDKEGNKMEDEEVIRSYYYGDKLIPASAIDGLEAYHSGDKCLRLIVCTPRKNIKPYHLAGDGTTLFYPTEDRRSENYMSAFIKALHNLDRVAIVRKVYRKGTSVVLGCLSPDLDRRCLVFNELCFADDLSLPSFEPLVRNAELKPEEPTPKEALIDDFINNHLINDFTPVTGPVDPFAVDLRTEIIGKILPNVKKALKEDGERKDNVMLHFEMIQELQRVDTDKFAIEFPLIEDTKSLVGERPSGAMIFRKREADEVKVEPNSQGSDEGEAKRVKLEVDGEEVVQGTSLPLENDDDMLDDL